MRLLKSAKGLLMGSIDLMYAGYPHQYKAMIRAGIQGAEGQDEKR